MSNGREDLEDTEDVTSQQPACVSCRSKKQKCSRGNPCQACQAAGIQCLYVKRRIPGTKPGFYENITKRLEQLESIVVGQSMLFSMKNPDLQYGTESPSLDQVASGVKLALQNVSTSPVSNGSISGSDTHKRLLQDNKPDHERPVKIARNLINEFDVETFLPPDDILQDLCGHYFREIHPYIPILHEKSFLETLFLPNRTTIILQAITAVTVKFTNMSLRQQDFYYQRCRNAVVLAAMDRFSVDTLQASIIIAYHTLGSGKGPRSWSIISSATRIVEQLGLSEEEEDMDQTNLLNRVGFLKLSKNLAEKEARRRIFWSIFQMDRFCSVTTGWNTSLTSTEVKRLLPIEGHLWRDNISKKTRYFNISDNDVDPTDENDALGGYAYCIEAVECLSRVASFLLKEKVDFSTSNGVKSWFNRFQELDSMLVRWKTFLPPKWQFASVIVDGKLDENLTLAHVTHNASVILLHQNVAFPPAELNITLMSHSSTQTCIAAATEITTIMTNFLTHVAREVSPQFSFLIFVAARTFLTESLRNKSPLNPNFDTLVSSLKEMSRRWCANGSKVENLASKFATRLEIAKNMKSPIDAKEAVFAEDDEDSPTLSLSSPPIIDVFKSHFLQEVNQGSFDSSALNNLNFSTVSNIDQTSTDMDHIFTWQGYPDKTI